MNHDCMTMTLKPKPNHPNESVQKSQNRKKHLKFGQMWRFGSLFSLSAMFVRSIRNTTLMLCTNYAKQFVRNTQNCGETNHGFCTIITQQLAHTSMLVHEFLSKNKTVIMSQPPYSPELASADFFLSPKLKTPMKGKSFAAIEEIKGNRNRNCWRHQKACFKSVSRIGKNAALHTHNWSLQPISQDYLSSFSHHLWCVC